MFDRAPTPTKISKAAALAVASISVFDTFGITERQGSKTSIGDIPLARYGRLIKQLGKSAWVRHREYMAIYLLNESKPAHYPSGALTRDIFDEAMVNKVVKQATELALPKVEAKDMVAHV